VVKDSALFSIPLADLEYGDREIDEAIPIAWLTEALKGTEATVRGSPGHLTVTVSKNGRDVMVRGKARAEVTMPCARTLDPVNFELSSDVFLMLSPAPAVAVRTASEGGKSGKKGDAKSGTRPERKKRQGGDDSVLDEAETARDTYQGDRVVLDPFVREFLLLELPMVPLREDLRSEATPAIERPPVPADEVRPASEAIDPRLAPLAAIASRLRAKKE
jgi:uncharacterized protein